MYGCSSEAKHTVCILWSLDPSANTIIIIDLIRTLDFSFVIIVRNYTEKILSAPLIFKVLTLVCDQ